MKTSDGDFSNEDVLIETGKKKERTGQRIFKTEQGHALENTVVSTFYEFDSSSRELEKERFSLFYKILI